MLNTGEEEKTARWTNEKETQAIQNNYKNMTVHTRGHVRKKNVKWKIDRNEINSWRLRTTIKQITRQVSRMTKKGEGRKIERKLGWNGIIESMAGRMDAEKGQHQIRESLC